MNFDFISDEQFRTSLLNDYREVQSAQEQEAWKAVQVLAGSIIEAVLIEYLIVSKTVNEAEALKMDLGKAIQACKSAGAIQDSTASLCDVIRGYRNLIHPGRVMRLEQEVTAEGANIAVSLVKLIVKEVATKRKTVCGATAEQIISKLKSDQHSLAVLPYLLAEMNKYELGKLVKILLPESYSRELPFMPDEALLLRFRTAYREALTYLDETEQADIAQRFAKMVREGTAEQIQTFCDAFFIAEQISYLTPSDAAIVRTYLLKRLESPGLALTDQIIETMAGIANFVDGSKMEGLSDILVKLLLRQSDSSLKLAIGFIGQVFDKADEPRKEQMEERIRVWVENAKKRGMSERTQHCLAEIQNQWLVLPF